VIRTFIISRYRYPELYKALFTDMQQVPVNQALFTAPMPATGALFLNTNKRYIVSIHEDATAMSTATTTNYNTTGYKMPLVNANNGNYYIGDNSHFMFF
jgi:hypothetical protein